METIPDLKVKTKNGSVPGIQMSPCNQNQIIESEPTNNKVWYQEVHWILEHMDKDSTRAAAHKLGNGITRGTYISCLISITKQNNLNCTVHNTIKEPNELFSSDISSSHNVAYNSHKYWILVCRR